MERSLTKRSTFPASASRVTLQSWAAALRNEPCHPHDAQRSVTLRNLHAIRSCLTRKRKSLSLVATFFPFVILQYVRGCDRKRDEQAFRNPNEVRCGRRLLQCRIAECDGIAEELQPASTFDTARSLHGWFRKNGPTISPLTGDNEV